MLRTIRVRLADDSTKTGRESQGPADLHREYPPSESYFDESRAETYPMTKQPATKVKKLNEEKIQESSRATEIRVATNRST